MSETKQNLVHWADHTADRLIRQKGDKDLYTLASGITPSGVVHFGNFREVMTVDLVARALRDQGKNVRFIFSWDDYDTFRKVPANMPKQTELAKYLYQPIVDTPDPFGKASSYAAHHEQSFESQLKKVGVEVEPLYQSKKYRAKEYNEEIIKTLKARKTIANILNEFRKEPLASDWLPVAIYCENCNRDRIKTINYDEQETLSYECELCSHQGSENIKNSSRVKLPWRMDWPMRWAFEKVDFEPGGKDHSSQGGSYSTAKEIVREVYAWEAPVYLQYDFVSIKGGGGKMSSSKGEVVTVNDVLNVYEPEMVRWIFASYKSNVDFSVSFDLDVIKTYEDFDRMERLAYGQEQGNEKKVNMAKRVYELSQIKERPSAIPFQPAFRHLCNILQIHDLDIKAAKSYYKNDIKNERDERRFRERSHCAVFWIKNYAPEDFKYTLNKDSAHLDLNQQENDFLLKLKDYLKETWDSIDNDKQMHEKLYEVINQTELTPNEAFPVVYRKLINKEKGPKLAGFIRTIGKDRFLKLMVN